MTHITYWPATGEKSALEVTGEEYRRINYDVIWRYNPYNGHSRQLNDIASDPFGLLIPVPGEPLIAAKKAETSGLIVNYYLAPVTNPNQGTTPYTAECSDIIEALGMNFNEGTAFKSIWRKAAERTLGLKKASNNAVRDAEKMAAYGLRELSVLTGKRMHAIEKKDAL